VYFIHVSVHKFLFKNLLKGGQIKCKSKKKDQCESSLLNKNSSYCLQDTFCIVDTEALNIFYLNTLSTTELYPQTLLTYLF
jgi:hypothetical protein